MNEVLPGIYQMSLPIPAPSPDHVNSYLVRGDNGCLLVDTGWHTETAFASMKDQLAEAGVGFEDITQIVITHVHPDHYGLAGKLKQLSRASIALHHLEAELIKSRYINMDSLIRRMGQWLRANGVPAGDATRLSTASASMVRFVTPTLPDITLHGGEVITSGSFSFRVLWSPGHSPGHISLYEPQQKVLVSGDHILADFTPNIGLHPQSGVNPLAEYLGSLRAIGQTEVSLVLPGHGQPFAGARQRIEQIIHHHEERKSAILRALDSMPKTAYQIATAIDWKQGDEESGWDRLGLWDRRMAVLETLSHLEAMRIDGGLHKSNIDGTVFYRHI